MEYETMTPQAFIDKYRVKMTSKLIDRAALDKTFNPKHCGPGHTSFLCTIRCGHTRKQASFYYTMGSAHTGDPDLRDVLDCLRLDYSVGQMNFYDYCSEFGFDPDTEQNPNEVSWNASRKNKAKIERLFPAQSILDDLQSLEW